MSPEPAVFLESWTAWQVACEAVVVGGEDGVPLHGCRVGAEVNGAAGQGATHREGAALHPGDRCAKGSVGSGCVDDFLFHKCCFSDEGFYWKSGEESMDAESAFQAVPMC